MPWSDGVGITQCVELADARSTVREFLEPLEMKDTSTANITIWTTPTRMPRGPLVSTPYRSPWASCAPSVAHSVSEVGSEDGSGPGS